MGTFLGLIILGFFIENGLMNIARAIEKRNRIL